MADRHGFPQRVGVVGLGAMGAPIARHLLGAGFELWCCDLDDSAVGELAGAGARAAQSPAVVGSECEVVLLLVPTDEDVLAVGEQVLGGSTAGSVVAICSSVRPDTCHQLASLATPASVAVLDVALTGGVRGAEAGTTNLLVGGEAAELDRIRPVLAAFSTAAHHLGPLGSGQVGKTVNNLIHWAQIAAITEALTLGEGLGVPADRLRTALEAGPTDSRTLREIEQMRLTWWVKDIDNALRMATEAGQELALTRQVQALMPGITVSRIAELVAGVGREGSPVKNSS